MNVSAWSIRNPVPGILLFGLLTVFGIAGFRALGIQSFPDIELPSVVITAALEGAAPSQLETEVARKIEDQVATLGGVEHIISKLTDGVATITVSFNIDKNTEVALSEVRNAVDSVRAHLPQEMSDPIVSKITTTGNALQTFTAQSDSMDEGELSWFVDNKITKALMAVKGIGSVTRVGGVDREVSVDLDPIKMAAQGLTAAEVSLRLKQVQQESSGGRGDVGGAVQSVRTLATVQSTRDIAGLTIPLSDGRSIYLSDIATVRDTIAERSKYTLLNGKQVVGFKLSRIKGQSDVDVASAVRKVIAKLQVDFPQVKIEEATNTVDAVEDNYRGSMELLYEGALLAILVVWLFLRDWRATLVATTALPLSIIPAFAVMYYFDFSLNILTLLALALVVGILVDDAIVEIENIVRHLRMGKTPYQAAMEAADEIGLAVIATSMTLVAVFLPTAFMGGIPGKFFKQFGITAAVAVLASLLVARMLTPMMAAYFLTAHGPGHKESEIKRRYLNIVDWCLAHRKTTVGVAVAFFIGSLGLAAMLQKGFIPPADRNQTAVKIELPPGSTLDNTLAAAEQARAIIAPVSDITSVFTAVGMSSGGGPFGMGADSDVRKATLTINLKHRRDRPRKQTQIESELRDRLRALPGVRVTVGAGDAGDRYQLALIGEDPVMLNQASHAVERELRTLPGLGNISSSASLQRPEIHITPDFARAADLGMTAAALASAIRVATFGDFDVQLSKLNLPERQIPIRVRLDRKARQDIEAIKQLRIATRGGQVPLSAVATIELASGPSQVDRLDRKRSITTDIELAGRPLGEVAGLVMQLPALKQLPPGISMPASGDAERMKEMFGSFGTAMLIGILCIYVVLVLLFHDFLQPATILSALPLSVGGAFLGLLITNNAFSMPVVIGLLMLMGIVTKNSILLVEYTVMARREHGLSRYDALIDACRKRVQPIIMTTVAMGAGMMPVALGIGAEPSFRAPMAIAVIGGLITSTFLSLLVIPVVFSYVDDLLQWLKRMMARIANQPVVTTKKRA
ncbi:MAG: efflux RND transporter permease subunit [Pseudomonadota bacterium]